MEECIFLKETELYEPVKNLLKRDLGCSDVYGEIQNCDVVGKRGNYDVIVELKTALNFKVILQAIDRKNNGAYTYIAVPKPKGRTEHFSIYRNFIKPHGIGLIYVEEYTTKKNLYEKYNDDGIPFCKFRASVVHKAKINHLYVRHRIGGISQLSNGIEEWEKKNVGGSKGGEIITAYSIMIDDVKEYLKVNGWTAIDEIIEKVPIVSKHYTNPKASLSATLKEKWNIHWLDEKFDPNERKRFFKVKERDVL